MNSWQCCRDFSKNMMFYLGYCYYKSCGQTGGRLTGLIRSSAAIAWEKNQKGSCVFDSGKSRILRLVGKKSFFKIHKGCYKDVYD